MLKILGYGCSTSAGPSTSDFWRGLKQGVDHSKKIPHKTSQGLEFTPKLCRWPNTNLAQSYLERLTDNLLLAWRQCPEVQAPQLGVIFASTKGCIEDFVWSREANNTAPDPLVPVLNHFLAKSGLAPRVSVCVSSACSSVMVALVLAKQWVQQKRVQSVLIVAADALGPFVTQGFFSLRALTSDVSRPFDKDRDGLQLGEAAAALLVSGEGKLAGDLVITGVETETEGHAVTRPSLSGSSLMAVVTKALGGVSPDFAVAHGTGTIANDTAEDFVLSKIIPEKAFVTGTKWSVGHTLGSSAALDIIAACEILKNQEAFCLANTKNIDPAFMAPYLTSGKKLPQKLLNTALVTSLGFGGIQGAAAIRREVGTS